MSYDTLSVDPGGQSGRIAPAEVAPADGAFVFCLGRDAPGLVEWVAPPGNYADVSQTALFPAGLAGQLTFSARGRPPSRPLPAGYSWLVEAKVDGAQVSARTLPANGDVIDWSSWQIDLTAYDPSEDHEIEFAMSIQGSALPSGPGLFPYMAAEIPAVYLDAIVFAAPPISPLIENLVPENQQGIANGAAPAASTSIQFDVLAFGHSVSSSTLAVTVNGHTAVTAGAAASGWTLATSAVPGGGLRVQLTPTTAFDSSEVVSVSATCSGAATSWSFEIADTVPPVVAAAQARDVNVVRVVFDEPVAEVSAAAAGDATNPACYALAPVLTNGAPGVDFTATPAVTPNVVSVAIVSSTTVDLTTDIELTPGIDYELTATGVRDIAGNAGDSSAEFPSFLLPSPTGRVFDLYRWLPLMNRQEDTAATRDLVRFVRCVQEVSNLLLYEIDEWSSILSIDDAPEPWLDAMLADLGNPFPFVLEEIDKRRLLKILVAIYKQKGTAVGIINAVRFFLGLTITIESFSNDGFCVLGVSQLGVNWVLGPGNSFARYSFRIDSSVSLTSDQIEQITWIANYMKPGHTHLIEVVVPTTPPAYDPMELGISELGVDWLMH